jgi:hypothetical protein
MIILFYIDVDLDEVLRDILEIVTLVVQPIDVRTQMPLQRPATLAPRQQLHQVSERMHLFAFLDINFIIILNTIIII